MKKLGTAIVVGLILSGCGNGTSAPGASAEANPVSAVYKKSDPDFGIKPDQFVSIFNAEMKDDKLPYRISSKISIGENNDTFSGTLNEQIAVVGSVSKISGNVNGVMVAANGDGSVKSGFDAMVVAAAMFVASLPNVDQKDINPIVLNLMNEASDAKDRSASRVLNGLKLSYMQSDAMGNVFSVQPIK